MSGKVIKTGIFACVVLGVVLGVYVFLRPVAWSPTPERIKVRLGWQVNANSAGPIVALEKGFYAEEKLDVALLPGGLDNSSVRTVATGDDDVGFANSPDLVVNSRAAGAPLKIIAVIHQRGYHGFVARKGSGINTPKDWEGKRIGVKYASPTYLLYQVLARKFGIDRSTIKEVPLQYGLQPFLTGEIDVYPGAFTNEAISFELLGVSLDRIDPAAFGVETLGNVIIANERNIEKRPGMLGAFTRATIRGWDWCLKPENQEEAVQMLLRHSPDLKAEKERKALAQSASLVLPLGHDGRPIGRIGRIDRDRLASIVKYMHEFGVIDRPIPVDGLYTTQFLPR